MKKNKILALLFLGWAVLSFAPGAQAQTNRLDEQKQPLNYVIKYGDTLARIATIFNVPVGVLMEYNPWISDENEIKAGYGLRVPLGRVAADMEIPETMAGQIMVLPPELLEVPPEMIKEIIAETMPAFVAALPEQIDISPQSLGQIMDAFNKSVERMVSAIPRAVDLEPQVYGRISDSARQGVDEALSPLTKTINEHKTWLNERLDQGKAQTSITGIKWLTWLIFLLLIVVLVVLAYLALYFRRTISAKQDIDKQNEQQFKSEFSSKNTDSSTGSDENDRKNYTYLGPAYQASREDFEKWLKQAKTGDIRQAHCFRCGTEIMTKNMKRHIFERCEKKPEWTRVN